MSSQPDLEPRDEAAGLHWSRSVFALVVVVALAGPWRSPISRCTRAGTRSRTACYWWARAEGVTARRSGSGSAAARAGIQRGDVLLAVNGAPVRPPRGRHRVTSTRPRGHSAALHAAASWHPRGAGGRAGGRRRRAFDVLRAGGRRTLHAAGRRVGPAASGRTIRRRCISSGCASRSSVSSRSRSTVRSIVSTGSSTGATRWRRRCCRRCCCTSRWSSRSAPAAPAAAARRTRARAAHVLAGAGAGGAGASSPSREARPTGPLFSSAIDMLDRAEPLYLLACAAAALVVLVRGFREMTSVTGAPPAALDRLGHRARRRTVRARLRAAVGARVSIRRSRCS